MTMPQRPKEGRNGEFWRLYCRGMTQQEIADRFEVSVATVSRAIRDVGEAIPPPDRKALIDQEYDFMRSQRQEILELWDAEAPPMTIRIGEGYEFLRDPLTKTLFRDYTGAFTAQRLALEYTKQIHRVLGLEVKHVDLSGLEEAAALLAAAEAQAHLHDGATTEEAET
jgi:transcriptional regulator with XRE-family HTH domain